MPKYDGKGRQMTPTVADGIFDPLSTICDAWDGLDWDRSILFLEVPISKKDRLFGRTEFPTLCVYSLLSFIISKIAEWGLNAQRAGSLDIFLSS